MVEHWVGSLVPLSYKDDFRGVAEANFQFELTARAGAVVRISVSFTHSLRNSIVVAGTRGKLSARVDVMDRCVWESDGGLRGDIAPSNAQSAGNRPFELASAFAAQLLDFGQVIAGIRPPEV